MSRAAPPTARLGAAYSDLIAAVTDQVDEGDPPPCWDRPEWITDDPGVLAEVAQECVDCPLRRPCARAALALNTKTGTWGGYRFTDPASRAAARRFTEEGHADDQRTA